MLEGVGQAEVQHRYLHIGFRQQFGNAGTGAAGDHVIFERDETAVSLCEFENERAVERAHEAHIDHGEAEFFADFLRRRHDRTEREQGDSRTAAADFGLAEGQSIERRLDRRAGAGAARVAHRRRACVAMAGAEHLPAFVFVAGSHHHHVRHAAHEAEIEIAGVRRPIGADHAAAVDGEQHVEVLDRHIVHQLVVAALQESGVDRHYRLGAFAGHAGGQRDRVLLGDGDIEITIRIFLAETHQARALAHRRSDGQQTLVRSGHVAQPFAEDIGVGGFLRAGFADHALGGVERRHRVVADLVAFGEIVALALGGHDVQQLRALEGLQQLQRGHQRADVVAVDRAGVVEAHLLEQRGRHEHALPVFFPAAHEARGAAGAFVAEQFLAAFADRVEGAAAGHAAEHLGQPADVLADRHLVVVQNHQQIGFGIHAAGVVQRFVGHAGGHRAVADHRHHPSVAAAAGGGDRHAQRCRNRGRGVADAEGVVFAFLALRERRHPVLLLHRMDGVAATGEDLVRVGLVADVPDEAVVRGVVEVMQGGGEFDHAQAGAEMAAAAADRFDQVRAQFVADRPKLVFGELAQIGGTGDARKARVARGVDHDGVGESEEDNGLLSSLPPHSGNRSFCRVQFGGTETACCGQRPRRRSSRPPDFPPSPLCSAKPVARLALMKSITSAAGTLLAAAISAMVEGPFIIAVAMRKWRGYSRSVCGHLLSTKRPSGSKPGSILPSPASKPPNHCRRASGWASPRGAVAVCQARSSSCSKSRRPTLATKYSASGLSVAGPKYWRWVKSMKSSGPLPL